MPQYKKAFDIGTYTGNGGLYRVGIPTLRGPGPTNATVAGSTRFRSSGSTQLTRTFVTGNTKKYTWSSWIKRGTIGSIDQGIIWASSGNNSSEQSAFYFTNDSLKYFNVVSGTTNSNLVTTLSFRDTTAWFHALFIFDSTNATSTDRVQIWINGSRVTSFSTATYPSLNQDTYLNNAFAHTIGRDSKTATSFFDGHISEIYFIDGQALTPSSFGQYNTDGIWVPKSYSGTYGTNGFYLPMNNNSNYINDQSGNGNNWTSSGFNVTTANTTYDIMTDSPTDYLSGSMSTANNAGNYATMDPNQSSGSQTSIINGGLTATKTGAAGYYNLMFSSFPMSSGKWYWEVTNGSTADISVGITTSLSAEKTAGNAGGSAYGYVYQNWTGQKRNNGTGSTYGATFTQNDVIGVALDMDGGTLTFYKNGASQGTAFTGISGTAYAEIGDAGNTQTTGHMNFGQRAFAYTPPTGYKALNTYNITRPADSSLWFYGDSPDFMWIKNRGVGGSNVLSDTVKGINLAMFSDTTGAENGYPYVMEMNKFGMSLQAGTGVNASGSNFVYWAWKAGSNTSSSSVTNTSGSITSQVSANPLAGFSIVSYTGTGVNATVGHGLSAAPNFIIVKIRNSAVTANWGVYHSSLGNTQLIRLDSAAAAVTSATAWNNTSPTSSVFSVGTVADTNYSSSATYIAYCWTAIPGYSAFGSYTGNGASDGPFVYLGFRPRWLMVKEVSGTNAATAYWCISDSTRSPYNDVIIDSFANTNDAEVSGSRDFDYLSNGFKLRTSNRYSNESSGVYIYAAFAEIPFKFARSR